MEKEDIKLECLDLQVGSTKRYRTCPCPRQKPGVFTVTREEDGLVYNCFSAGCSERGVCGSRSGERRPPPPPEPKTYGGELVLPPALLLDDLYTLYSLERHDIKRSGWRWAPHSERLYFPLYNMQHEQVGEQLKRWSPEPGRPKSETFKWSDPLYHVTSEFWRYPGPVVLVEDPISALKVGKVAKCVALLGTHLSQAVVHELVTYTDVSGLICMLDPDTWEMPVNPALKIIDSYRCMFPEGVRAIRLSADPKAVSYDELEELLSS